MPMAGIRVDFLFLRWNFGEEASEAYDQCLAIDECYAPAYMARGAIEMNLGAWDVAAQLLNRFWNCMQTKAAT